MTTMTMEPSEDSIDGMSNDELNEAEMDSSGPPSDTDDVADIDTEKLDASHREILEKLKRQELEEREEIERELRDAQREAIERARVHEEMRAQELRAQELVGGGGGGDPLQAQDLRTPRGSGSESGSSSTGKAESSSSLRDSAQTEILTQRPPGLLAQHGLTTKHHDRHHSTGNGAHGHRDRGMGGGVERERDLLMREQQQLHQQQQQRGDPSTNSTASTTSSNGGGSDRLDSGRLPGAPPAPAGSERGGHGGDRGGGGSDGERRSPPHHGYLSPPMPQSFIDRFPRPSPPTPGSTNGDGLGGSPAHHWTFEEQFKQGQGVPQSQLEKQIAQLYELSDDPKRKEFLDDLFSFMQKRGTPVNRIPIMAKQTLDLYELFRLVVSKGGLVEVINKKLWREITKGLNLPSSITSAAFTLRTQYMKYLYPYECEKLKLSSPQELQSAIDGNRREGRRPSYGYDFSPMPTLMPTTPPHLNGALLNGRPPSDWLPGWKPPGIPVNPHHLATAQKQLHAITQPDTKDNESSDGGDPHWPGLDNPCPVPVRTLSPRTANFFLASMRHQQSQQQHHQQQQQHHQQQQQQQQQQRPQLNNHSDEENTLPPTPAHIRSIAERDARAMEAATRAMEQATKRMEQASKTTTSALSPAPGDKRPSSCSPPSSIKTEVEPPLKRPASDDERALSERSMSERLMASTMAHVGMPSAHLKITSRNDGRSEFDNSLVVSMEVNGIMYQGVLFAQHQAAAHQRRI